MATPSSPPWPKIHRFLSDVGEETTPHAFWDAVLKELRTLVPFEAAQVVFRNRENTNFHSMQSIFLSDRSVQRYPFFWNRLHSAFRKTRLPHDPIVFYTTSQPFVATEFGQTWVRPLGFEFSAGISIDDNRWGNPLQLILYRGRSKVGFTPTELRILHVLQPHLKNLHSLLCHAQAYSPVSEMEAKLLEFKDLTKREREIAMSLCSGNNTVETSTKLFISPATTYRHVSNIFVKLGVTNRQALVAKLLFLPPEDVHNSR